MGNNTNSWGVEIKGKPSVKRLSEAKAVVVVRLEHAVLFFQAHLVFLIDRYL